MNNPIKVLLYHRVTNIENDYNLLAVSPENFDKQMEYLKNHYQIIRLEDDWSKIVEPSICVTFDDGYEDSYTEALPILEKWKIPASFFITTGNISSSREFWHDDIIRMILTGEYYPESFELKHDIYGQSWPTETLSDRNKLYQVMRYLFQRSTKEERADWRSQLLRWSGMKGEGRANRRSMTEEQCRLLSSSPYITIGAHTVNHIALSKQSREIQYREILDSKLYLEDLIHQEVEFFSYPFGGRSDYSKDTLQIVRELNFKKTLAVFEGDINEGVDLHQIPRYLVRNWDVEQFAKKVEAMFCENLVIKQNTARLEYFGRQEDDRGIFKSDSPIVIWGSGARGIAILKEFETYKIYDNIVGFADNNKNKWGSQIEGLDIYSLASIGEKFKEPIFVIGSTYEREIIKQLQQSNYKHIHLYI